MLIFVKSKNNYFEPFVNSTGKIMVKRVKIGLKALTDQV